MYVFLKYVYHFHVSTCKVDTFVAMPMDVPKRGHPPKPRPDTPTPKQPRGRPRKADSDQPAQASQPIGRPRKYPVFGAHPQAVSILPVILETIKLSLDSLQKHDHVLILYLLY